MESQYKQIQDHSADDPPALNPTSKDDRRKRWLKISCSIILIFLIVAILIGVLLYFFWLPNYIQSQLDTLSLTMGETFITDPEWTSIRIVTSLTSPFSFPFATTMFTPNPLTFLFCPDASNYIPANFTPPSNMSLPFNVTWDCDLNTNSSVLGTASLDDLHLGASESANFLINTTLNVSNMMLFKVFGALTVETKSVTFRLKGNIDVGVTILGISLRFNNFNLQKDLALTALEGLPGIETEFIDFYLQDHVPMMNSSLTIQNPALTWLEPLGDCRFIWHNELENPLTLVAFAETIAPNFRIDLNTFTVPLFGPLQSPPTISPESSTISKLIENYINGRNTSSVIFSYSSPCCLRNETVYERMDPPCTCTPASTIPFWRVIMAGLWLFVRVVSVQSIDLFLELHITAASLLEESIVSGSLVIHNPFGIPLTMPQVELTLSTTVPIFFINSSFPSQINSYQNQNVSLIKDIDIFSYTNGSQEYEAFVEFALLLETRKGGECSVHGIVKWWMEHIPIEIIYDQLDLKVTMSRP